MSIGIAWEARESLETPCVACNTVGLYGVGVVHRLQDFSAPVHVIRGVAVQAFQTRFPMHAVAIESGLVALEASTLRHFVSRGRLAISTARFATRLIDCRTVGAGLRVAFLTGQIPIGDLREQARSIFMDVLAPIARAPGVQTRRKSFFGQQLVRSRCRRCLRLLAVQRACGRRDRSQGARSGLAPSAERPDRAGAAAQAALD